MKHPCGKEFDASLPVETRTGIKSRILCADLKSGGKTKIAVAGYAGKDYEAIDVCCPCGHWCENHQDHASDLINISERKDETNYEKLIVNALEEINKELEALASHNDPLCCGIKFGLRSAMDMINEPVDKNTCDKKETLTIRKKELIKDLVNINNKLLLLIASNNKYNDLENTLLFELTSLINILENK